MATADTVDVYNGAPDHYEWALLGKREMLVPYNSYAVHQKGLAYGDILKSRFINPDLLRYELHRVWVVEATLRKGFSHPYAKRRFYFDEDSWQILAADIYDKDGVLTGPRKSIRSTTTMCRWSPAPWKRSTTSRAAATSSMGWTTTSRCTTSACRSGRATSPRRRCAGRGTEADGPQTISSAPRSVPSSSRRAGAGLICRYLMLSRGISSRSPSTSTLR